MIADINHPLRTKILDKSLQLEYYVSELILNYLNIDNEKRKAITNKSGNLSFQNRIDLLFDLKILTKEENENFTLLMVFRNQFMHNINCNSFVSAMTFLGEGKKKELLKFSDEQFKKNLEFYYNNAFENLFVKCYNVIIKKNEDRLKLMEENEKALIAPQKGFMFVLGKLHEIDQKIRIECSPKDSDIPEVAAFKQQLLEISKELDKLDTTEEYKKLIDHFEDLTTNDVWIRFLKSR